MDSLQECCHCNDTTVVITSIDLVSDLLTSLEQLINSSDVPVLNVELSPSGSTLADADIGIDDVIIISRFSKAFSPANVHIKLMLLSS